MLELKNICSGYGKLDVLKGISASFEKGELISIIGVNGCGKSTLLKTVVGILSHREGNILVDGADISTMERNEVAKRISYLPQGKSTPDMTVRQMVLHGRFPYLKYPRRYGKEDRAIAEGIITELGLADNAEAALSSLSGGRRQIAYIAMALAQNTDYILLDEPTTYLDIAHQLSLMKMLKKLSLSGKGIITVMHDLPMAFSFSDKIVIINDGEIVYQGAPENIYNSELIKAIFGISIKRIAGEYSYDLRGKFD